MTKVLVNNEYRDATADELARFETDNQSAISELETLQAEKTAKATNQASGNQKLLDLGLTQAEATALTGYTPPTEV